MWAFIYFKAIKVIFLLAVFIKYVKKKKKRFCPIYKLKISAKSIEVNIAELDQRDRTLNWLKR